MPAIRMRLQPKPYPWEGPPEAIQLWKEVGNKLDKRKEVVWKKAVESLDAAKMHLRSFKGARDFVEEYMASIIDILVQQEPSKIGPHERNCVKESLSLAVDIVSQDLEIQLARNGECMVLDVLALVFNKEKAYYKGLPEVRMRMIDSFLRGETGFACLHRDMLERFNVPTLQDLDTLHHILTALGDSLPLEFADQTESIKKAEDAAIVVSTVAMQFLKNCTDETFKGLLLNPQQVETIFHDLQEIFDRLVNSRRDRTYEFYSFWRSITLRLITSQSLPLKLFGWQQTGKLSIASALHRPSPRGFEVSGAGCTFVNGKYIFMGSTAPGGYAGGVSCYSRKVPESDGVGGGKTLTLFRCTMRSGQKWWFLSEADEEQPGTDHDIDYYLHKSKEHIKAEPPPSGWVTCRNVGVDPPPQLKGFGRLVPPGEEFNTLDHQLAQWAIENRIIELMLQDSVHQEIVSDSTTLIRLLSFMCKRDDGIENNGSKTPNMFCLQMSHLMLAWNTCGEDATVSAPICRLLASILPSCPSSLAMSLLLEIKKSLHLLSENYRDYMCFREVEMFCLALADASQEDAVSALKLSNEVQGEVMTLVWQLLTHPRSTSLKDRDCVEKLWSLLASAPTSPEQHCPSSNGHGDGLIQDVSSESKRAKRSSSVLESLTDELILTVFQYVGPEHYYFVAGVSKRCREMYRNATSSVVGRSVIPKTTTTIARTAESVSRSQLYLFQETIIKDHATDDGYVELTRRMRRKIGERALSVAKAAASSGNLLVLNFALKQPEGISFICNAFSICKDAVKNGDVPMLELALSLGCPGNEETCGLAAEYGQFEALQKLRENGCPWNESVCSFAASNGDLAMLQYARENNCRWNRSTLVNARANGHLELAQWASENGCPSM